MEKNNNEMQDLINEFNMILEYEKVQKTPTLSSQRILEYFGYEDICKMHGCTVITVDIAYHIVRALIGKQ